MKQEAPSNQRAWVSLGDSSSHSVSPENRLILGLEGMQNSSRGCGADPAGRVVPCGRRGDSGQPHLLTFLSLRIPAQSQATWDPAGRPRPSLTPGGSEPASMITATATYRPPGCPHASSTNRSVVDLFLGSLCC